MKPNPRLATRYAKSLLDLAIEKGQLEAVYADIKWLEKVCNSNRDFVNILRSPIIHADTKRKIIQAVTDGNIGAITKVFNNLVIQKGRESHLPEIISAFHTQYKHLKQIHTVSLTTASPLSESLRNEIVAQVKKTGGFENIELLEHVNKDIIGGFVLKVGDKLVDASIAYDLKNIAKQFDRNDFIFNLR